MTGPGRSRRLGTSLDDILPSEEEGPPAPTGGLGAVIPQPPGPQPRPGGRAASGAPLRDDQVAFLGLELLARAFYLDLCAYLHQRTGKALQVQIRGLPSLLDDAEAAFAVTDEASDAFAAPAGPPGAGAPLHLAGMDCLAVATSGTGWRALHLLARRSSRLEDHERRLAEQSCRILSESLQASG